MLDFIIVTFLVTMIVAIGFRIFNEIEARRAIRRFEKEAYKTLEDIKKDVKKAYGLND